MNKKKLVRIIAIVLVALLAGGVVFGALISALSEAAVTPPGAERDRYRLKMTYSEDEQALRVEQRLVYINRTGEALDRVVFYAAANMLSRESTLIYETEDLERVFPNGYYPGGIDLQDVRVNGEAADYGFQGENELYLRVGCALEPGEAAEFEFDYTLTVPSCGAFIGAGATDVRLGAICFIPGVFDPVYHEFIVNKPLPFTRWLFSEAGDYEAELSIISDARYELACVGEAERKSANENAWTIWADDVREFALSFGRRWRVQERRTESGMVVRLMSGSRTTGMMLDCAVEALEDCEAWFGALPDGILTIAESDYPLGGLNYPGYMLLSPEYFEPGNAGAMKKQLRFMIAQQYFGIRAYSEPSADAWLSDSVSAYVACLLKEEREGHEAFLKEINRDWVSALQLTIPGGLTVTSDASLFSGYEYDVVVLTRGAVVLHELRQAMGRERLLDGLRRFYALGTATGNVLTEMDFVRCMDEASGYESADRSWEDFLTDWVFNVGEYVNQSIDWFE